MDDLKPEIMDGPRERAQAHTDHQRAIISQSQVDALVRIEHKLDQVLAFIEEAGPLIEAGQEMANDFAEQGPMGLLAGFLGKG